MKSKVGDFRQFFTKSRMKRYGKNTVLGIQHVFAMMGATIVVPMLTGMNSSVALITAGLGTIAFFFITGRKVPVFLGSSFAYLAAIQAVFAYGDGLGWDYSATMGRLSIAIMCAGAVYLLLSLITYFVGAERIKKLFPPIVVGPVIVVIGMTLAPSVISSNIVGAAMFTWQAWTIALVTAAIIIGVSIFAKGFFKVVPILFGILGGYVLSMCLGVVDWTKITGSNWVIFEPQAFMSAFGFIGQMRFDWTVILMIMPIAIVTFMEHLGDITTNGAIVGKNFFVDPGLHRTLLGDGVATMLAGFLGGPPNTTYGENTSVLAMTKNYDPKLLVLAACFAIVLGVFSKFGGVLASVPSPVIGGASMILFGMIASMGLKVLVDNHVDFTNTRNLIIVALILVIGLGFAAGGVKVAIGTVQISPLAICTVVGIVLNLILPKSKTPEKDPGADLNDNIAVTEDSQSIEMQTAVTEDSQSIETQAAQ